MSLRDNAAKPEIHQFAVALQFQNHLLPFGSTPFFNFQHRWLSLSNLDQELHNSVDSGSERKKASFSWDRKSLTHEQM
ncbi:hypothetical protein L1887_13889 [Cichorium endivia]|nr:hypothetical protein L1887_13889 [Cichorium endivia]